MRKDGRRPCLRSGALCPQQWQVHLFGSAGLDPAEQTNPIGGWIEIEGAKS
jgi:hypothetical protein